MCLFGCGVSTGLGAVLKTCNVGVDQAHPSVHTLKSVLHDASPPRIASGSLSRPCPSPDSFRTFAASCSHVSLRPLLLLQMEEGASVAVFGLGAVGLAVIQVGELA